MFNMLYQSNMLTNLFAHQFTIVAQTDDNRDDGEQHQKPGSSVKHYGDSPEQEYS